MKWNMVLPTLLVLFIGLKITSLITWSWWIVLIPLLIVAADKLIASVLLIGFYFHEKRLGR